MTSNLLLQNVRNKTRQSITMYKVSKLKTLIYNIKDQEKDLKQLLKKKEEINQRRKRLMAQNFSSAPHLEGAHSRYWKSYSQLNEQIREKKIELKYQVKKLKSITAEIN